MLYSSELKEVQIPLKNPEDVTTHRDSGKGMREALVGKKAKTQWYLQKLRRAQTRVTINTLKWDQVDDESTTRHKLKAKDANE